MKCPQCNHERESLAELADKKGMSIKLIRNAGYPVGWLIHFQPTLAIGTGGVHEIPDEESDNVYTYAEAESLARAYLSALPDTGEDKGGR